MKHVLLIQSRLRPERAQRECDEFQSVLPGGVQLRCVSVLDEEQAWTDPKKLLHDFDGVFIGGSGDFHLHGGGDPNGEAQQSARMIMERLRGTVAYVFEHRMPTLGVCFGHQLIAEMRGGEVSSDAVQKKTGTYEIQLTAEGKQDPVFSSLPEAFHAQFAHKDSVTTLPEAATVLASGSVCRFSALRYEKTIYTVQFHPESGRESMLSMAQQMPQYLPEGRKPEEIFLESPHASGLIARFVNTVV